MNPACSSRVLFLAWLLSLAYCTWSAHGNALIRKTLSPPGGPGLSAPNHLLLTPTITSLRNISAGPGRTACGECQVRSALFMPCCIGSLILGWRNLHLNRDGRRVPQAPLHLRRNNCLPSCCGHWRSSRTPLPFAISAVVSAGPASQQPPGRAAGHPAACLNVRGGSETAAALRPDWACCRACGSAAGSRNSGGSRPAHQSRVDGSFR